MPMPMVPPFLSSVPENYEGRWTEIEGIVHSVNTNGTLSVIGKGGSIYLWLGQTPSDSLARYVDAKVRVRGVLSLTVLDVPLLLVPSRSQVDVEEEAPEEPLGIAARSVANLVPRML